MEDDSEPATSRRSLRPRNAQGRAASSDGKNTSSNTPSSKSSANNTDVIDLSDLSDSPENDGDSDNSDVEFVPSATEAKKLSKGKRLSPSIATASSEELLANPSTSKGGRASFSKTRANLSNKLVPNNNLSQNNNGIPPMVLIAQNRNNSSSTPSNIVKFTMFPSAAGGTNGLSTVAPTALLVQSNSTTNPLMLQSGANSNHVLIPVSTTNAGFNIVGNTNNPNPFVSSQIQTNHIQTQRDLPVKIPAKTYSKTSSFVATTLSANRPPTDQQSLNRELFEKVRMVYLKCDDCGSEFHLKESFLGHIKYDHFKRPFQCLVRNCLLGFDEQSEYNEHVKSRHNLLTMYNCAKCTQVFKSYEYLSNHEELCHVTGLFQCSYCTLTSSKRMPIHMHHLQKHHHICHDCSRTLPSKNDLKIHTKQFHPNRQTIVVPAHKTIPVKQQLKKQAANSVPPAAPAPVVQAPIVEVNLPPVPPEPEESFCDPSRLLDVRLKEEELDEDVQVIRHPKKRKADGEASTSTSAAPPSVAVPNMPPSTTNGGDGTQKTRFIVIRRPDGTEQMVALAPGVTLPSNTGGNGPPKKLMVVVQKSALSKGIFNGTQAPVGQVSNLALSAPADVVEEPIEDAIDEQQAGSGNYTVVKLNCFVRCPKEFTSYKELLTHMDEAHCILPYRCLHRGCGRSFGSLNFLNRHVLYHAKTPEKFRCSFCDLTFSRHRELAEHLFNRHELGEFACVSAGCTYRSISRGTIDEHFQKEHGFRCVVPGCSANFKDTNEIESHEKTHDDYRRFYCKMFHADKGDSAACTFQSANKEEVLAHVKSAREGGANKDVNLKDYIGVITGWHPKTVKKLILEEDVVGAEEVESSTEKTTDSEPKEPVVPVEASREENGTADLPNETVDTSDESAPTTDPSGEPSNGNLSETLEASNEAPSEVGDEVPSMKDSETAHSCEVKDGASANTAPEPEPRPEPAAEANKEANETVPATNDTPLAEAGESFSVDNSAPNQIIT